MPSLNKNVADRSYRDHVYFKTAEVREMDDHFGDVYGIISDREIEISHELAQFALQYEGLFTSCSDLCGELDRWATRSCYATWTYQAFSILALAQGAILYNLIRPRMSLENTIQIKNGR